MPCRNFNILASLLALTLVSFFSDAHASERDFFGKCTTEEITYINKQKYIAKQAINYSLRQIKQKDNVARAAIRKFQGDTKPATISRVITNFEMSLALVDNSDMMCQKSSNPNPKAQYVVAGVYPSDPTHTVWYSRLFFEERSTGYKTRWGTLIHEMLHFHIFGAGLVDIEKSKIPGSSPPFPNNSARVYSIGDCITLVKKCKVKASMNTNNYRYIIEAIIDNS